MHNSFHLSCNSFPFFVCQLAEGFLMRQETVARSFGFYFGFLVRIAKIPRSIRGTISEDTQAHELANVYELSTPSLVPFLRAM
jgi:hypothetical protein